MTVRPYTTTEVARMAEMWAEGYSRQEIADATGRTYGGLKMFMMKHRDRFPRREMADLRKIDRCEILKLRKSGLSILKIAEALNVSYRGAHKALKQAEKGDIQLGKIAA